MTGTSFDAFLKNLLLRNFQGVVYCLIIKVLFRFFFFSETTLIFYHVVFCLSRSFFIFIFCLFSGCYLASLTALLYYHITLSVSRTFFDFFRFSLLSKPHCLSDKTYLIIPFLNCQYFFYFLFYSNN